MQRRSFLAAAFGLGLFGLLAPEGEASADDGQDGVTITLKPKNAPYPIKGGAYDDSTVIVFVPSFYRARSDGRVDFVTHFHGHMSTATTAVANHKLREQLADSRQNAVLVVPQGPVRAADGDFGKLMAKGGLRRLLAEVLGELAKQSKALGKASLNRKKSHVGRVVVSAHSGGYHAAAACAERGGVNLREIYLFDSLYGESATFQRFIEKRPKERKLVSYYVGGKPRELSLALADALTNKGVNVVREKPGKRLTRRDLVRGRAVFLEGKATHASATYEEQALRDCLFASCLEGRGSKEWHADKDAKRSS